MRVGGVVASHVGNGAGVAKAGQGVDMTVGIVAEKVSVVQPKDASEAEKVAEATFNVGSRKMVVAVLGFKASGGDEQGSASVGFDAAAFEG